MHNFIFKHRQQILLLIIFLSGVWLRFYQLPNQVWNQGGYDESRDMLVAEHLTYYQEKLNRGPLAAGGLNSLLNSPLYFYLVAAIWKIASTPTSFMYVWTLILSGQILLIFNISKKISDPLTGLIASAMVALHSQAIYQSRQLLQPFLLPLLMLLFLGSVFKTKAELKIKFLVWSIFFLLIPLHIHYGILIILPIGSLWLLYFWTQILDTKMSFKNVILPLIASSGLLFSWLITTYKHKIFDQLFFLAMNFYFHSPATKIGLGQKLHNFNSILMANLWPNLRLLPALSLSLVLILLAYRWLRKKHPDGLLRWLILVSLALSSLLSLFFSGRVADTYLLATWPFFIILFSLGLRKIVHFNKYIGLISLILILFYLYLPTRTLIFAQTPKNSFAKQNQELAKIIYQENKEPNFGLALLNTASSLPFDGWGTSGIWFYLEKMYQRPLIKITNYGVNHTPLNKEVETLYFVCDHRIQHSQALIQRNCLDKFVKNRNYLSGSPQLIYNSKNYTLWKSQIETQSLTGRSYSHVYRELLSD